MSDKIREDIYDLLKRKSWGAPLIFVALLFIALFAVWNSLPETTKVKLLNTIYPWESRSKPPDLILDTKAAKAPPEISIIRNIVYILTKDTNTKQAALILGQLNVLGNIIIPERYPVTIYKAIPMATFFDLKVSNNANAKTTLQNGISGALTYTDRLGSSVITIKSVLKNPQDYRLYGRIPNDSITIAGLNSILIQTEKEIRKVRHDLANSPIFIQARQYYIDNYL